MGRWLATLLLALAIAVPGSGAEGEPGGHSYQAEGAPKPDHEGNSVAPRRPAQIMAPVDSPSGIEGKSGHREHEAEQQNRAADPIRSEEHTSELQSLMRISYAVFCLKKKKHNTQNTIKTKT